MTTRTAIIASSVGLHARPASLFVQKVTRSGLPVTISRPGGKPVNAASMLAVKGAYHGCSSQCTYRCVVLPDPLSVLTTRISSRSRRCSGCTTPLRA